MLRMSIKHPTGASNGTTSNVHRILRMWRGEILGGIYLCDHGWLQGSPYNEASYVHKLYRALAKGRAEHARQLSTGIDGVRL